MSVAFRRESDEEHKEPRFELPIPAGPNLVTENGLALINRRIADLEAEQASADEPRREEIARDLRYWHTRRVTAIVAPPPPIDEIAFGSRVRVRTEGGTRRYSDDDLDRLRRIAQLLDDGLNLAGIAMVLDLERDNERLRGEQRAPARRP